MVTQRSWLSSIRSHRSALCHVGLDVSRAAIQAQRVHLHPSGFIPSCSASQVCCAHQTCTRGLLAAVSRTGGEANAELSDLQPAN